MKLPVIKTIQRTCTPEQIETALEVLENVSEAPSLKENEVEGLLLIKKGTLIGFLFLMI